MDTNMPRIMIEGMNISRPFQPEAEFGVWLRAISGTFSGIFLYTSPDKTNWEKGHYVEFASTGKQVDIFKVPVGLWCQLQGAAGGNVEARIGYMAGVNPHQYAIDHTIEGGAL